MTITRVNEIKVIFFDFGGVLAEEGFREGLMAIGKKNGLDPEEFFDKAAEAVYKSGYVIGAANESDYWRQVRKENSINMTDADMRQEILDRFIIRPQVIHLVRRLRSKGFQVNILSDQTDWLDELDRKYDFYKEFHKIINSYRIGKGKRDRTLFSDIHESANISPRQILFIDDNPGNVKRARDHGWSAILYRSVGQVKEDLFDMGLLDSSDMNDLQDIT